MGTSSSYGGHKDKDFLLPRDFDNDEGQNDDNQQNDIESDNNSKPWQNIKRQLSKFIREPNRNFSSVMKAYVKAYGGGREAASHSITGQKTTVSLGKILSSIASQGIHKTLEQINIEFIGRGVEEVFADLINKIAPIPDTRENAVARSALLDTLEDLYQEVAENNNDLTVLDNLDQDRFNTIMNMYIASYVFNLFLNELESRFEQYSENAISAIEVENRIKEYIDGVVNNKIEDRNMSELDYTSTTVLEIIKEIYTDYYEVIEGIL